VPAIARYDEKLPEERLHMKGLNDGEDPAIKLFDSTHWRKAWLVVIIRAMVMYQKETDVHYGTAILVAHRVNRAKDLQSRTPIASPDWIRALQASQKSGFGKSRWT
jgi:hypothetical protein